LAKLREPKVQQLRASFGEHHVGGLQIAVRDAARVRGIEGAGNFSRYLAKLVEWQRSANEAIRDRFAGDEFEDQEIDFGRASRLG
jgi:hypothetical protein